MSEKSLNALFIVFLLVIAAVSALHWDSHVSAFFADPNNLQLKQMALMITDVGLGGSYYILALVMFFGGDILARRIRILSGHPLKEMGQYLLWTLIGTGIVNSLIKAAVGRERPYHSPGFGSLNFHPLTLDADFQSFPSGHTQVIFTVAAFLCFYFPRWKAYWLTGAFLIAVSRVATLYHFPSDVICGGLVGWFVSRAIIRWLEKRSANQSKTANSPS